MASRGMRRVVSAWASAHRPRLELLGGFRLIVGGVALQLPRREQRLVACVALAEWPQSRSTVAGILWPDVPEWRALANLRTSLWRLGKEARRLLEIRGGEIALKRDATVDVREFRTLAWTVLQRFTSLEDGGLIAVERLVSAGELLPDWDEEWLVEDRERLHQLRLHALEAATDHLGGQGRLAEAIEAGLAALAADPLRESTYYILMQLHALEGNRREVVRLYQRYSATQSNELGLPPSAPMEALVRRLGLWVSPTRGGDKGP